MKALFVDLARHQSWADAEYWRALEKCAPAAADDTIRKRLHHLHQTQRVFHWLVDREDRPPFKATLPEDFASLADLREYAEASSRPFAEFVDAVTADHLRERVVFHSEKVPWLEKAPPYFISVAEALMQGVMHSQWHRGQNATRLRELGGEPPLVDLVVWVLKGRPAAGW